MKNTSLKTALIAIALIGLAGCSASGGSKVSAYDTSPPAPTVLDSFSWDEVSRYVNKQVNSADSNLHASITEDTSAKSVKNHFSRDLGTIDIVTQSGLKMATGTVGLYQMEHSAISTAHIRGVDTDHSHIFSDAGNTLHLLTILGETTSQLPSTLGSVNYTGLAAFADQNGLFNYNIDFNKKVGHGTITEISDTTITLNEVNLSNQVSLGNRSGIGAKGGTASTRANAREFNYDLLLMGPNAEEIVGVIHKYTDGEYNPGDLLFGGKR